MTKIKSFTVLFLILNFFSFFGHFQISAFDLGSCGKSSRARGVIIGGTSLSSAQRGHFPWVTALVTRENKYFCGGVLISVNAVLTAAHCMQEKGDKYQKQSKDVRSLLGIFDLEDKYEIGRFITATEEIRVHPKWNPDSSRYDGDIAVLIMDENVPFNNYIRPICLTKLDSEIVSIKTGVVVGYGLSSSYATAAENIPRLLNVPIHKNEECFIHNKELAGISSLQTFCAGTGNGTGVCLGDSGSGLYVQSNGIQYLKGIVSASLITFDRTCDVNDYAIYTSVSDYYDWIVGQELTHEEQEYYLQDVISGVCNGCSFGFLKLNDARLGICNACNVKGPFKIYTHVCNGCDIFGAPKIKTCNICILKGRNGNGWIDTCNGCMITEEAGPVWIKHCKGCTFSTCDGCIRNTEFVGVNVHIIEKCNGCNLEKCRGCLVSKEDYST